MKEGVDFNDTFAPVAKPVTLRALLAVATKHGCLIKSGDVETAFLTAIARSGLKCLLIGDLMTKLLLV